MKNFLLTASLALLVGSASAQCAAGFTVNQSQPNVIDFTNTSTPSFPATTSYLWDFGDNQYGWQQNPSHTYNAPGMYWVCLTLMDSLNNITCSFCDTVNVTGTVLCNLYCTTQQYPASCSSCNDGAASASPSGGIPPYSYSWSTGATTQNINNLLPGIYAVCITDASGCMACDSVTVGVASSSSCSITFNATLNSQWIFFQSIVTGSSNAYTVIWNFGDATVGTGDYAWHQYTNAGVYNVCATMYDSLTACTSTWCDTVYINSVPPTSCTANFYVQLDSSNTNLALIYNLSTGGPNMTYQWLWGDNTSDTGAYPSHVYSSTGSYNICLIVTDQNAQCTDTMCQLLWVPRLSYQASLAPFYVNVVPPTMTAITEPATTNDWALYPNPTNGELHIGNHAGSNDVYVITDLSGRTVQRGGITNNSIDVSTLSPGVYFFTLVKENGEMESKRFIRD